MSYRALMTVPVLGRANSALLAVTATLARKVGAAVIGVAACRPVSALCRDYAIPASVFDADRKQIERQTREGELQFRAALAGHSGDIEWRTHICLEPLASRLVEEFALADLILVSLDVPGTPSDTTRQPDLCDLVMLAGRPVLLVPSARPPAKPERVLVAWKDSREARRAVADSLPLLAEAAAVTVVSIEEAGAAPDGHNSVARVQAWLARHGIVASARIEPPRKANASQLMEIARDLEADLIVAGACGHVRHGRWVLGGITSQLLNGDTCALISH